MITRPLIEVVKLANSMQEKLKDDSGELVDQMLKMQDETETIIDNLHAEEKLSDIKQYPCTLDISEDEYTMLLMKFL